MRCSFCGYEFNPTEARTTCAGCPLVGDCHLIRCPRCGYEIPPEVKLGSWLRRLRQRWRAENPSSKGETSR